MVVTVVMVTVVLVVVTMMTTATTATMVNMTMTVTARPISTTMIAIWMMTLTPILTATMTIMKVKFHLDLKRKGNTAYVPPCVSCLILILRNKLYGMAM